MLFLRHGIPFLGAARTPTVILFYDTGLVQMRPPPDTSLNTAERIAEYDDPTSGFMPAAWSV